MTPLASPQQLVQLGINEGEQRLFDSITKNEPIGPQKVIISLTDWCNLHCKTCWRLDKEENPNNYREEELTFEEISEILQDCKSLGVKELDLTGGGEAFSHPRILDIIRLAKELGFWVTLTNNGTLLSEEMMRELIALGLDDITFSLDGSTAEVNDPIRGEGVFDKALGTLKKLLELKEELHSEVPVLRIGFVITNKNYQDVPGIVELAGSLGVPALQFSTLLEWGSNKNLSMSRCVSAKPTPLEKLKEGVRIAQKLGIHSNLSSIAKFGFFEHETPKFCYAPWELLFINSRGIALACCILASFYENVLGNIRETPLRELWHSKKMNSFRDQLGDGKFFNGCKRCLPDFVDQFNEKEGKRQPYNRLVAAGTGGAAWR